jgi:hypothetical protein
MRFGKFERSGSKPIGIGKEKKTFINPSDESAVISIIKEKDFEDLSGGIEKDSPRALKGSFYVTKIAHALLPDMIPDIYQAGESKDGQQSFDRERVAHTAGHTELQAARQAGESEKPAVKQLKKELGKGMLEADEMLADIGFGFSIDENLGNYTKDEKGNIKYFENLPAWEIVPGRRRTIELAFDKDELSEAIGTIADPYLKGTCEAYLARVLMLFEEEKEEFERTENERLPDSTEKIASVETQIESFKEKYPLDELMAIQTEEEANGSEIRTPARHALGPILSEIKLLAATNISDERLVELGGEFRVLSRAVGTINSGKVLHD